MYIKAKKETLKKCYKAHPLTFVKNNFSMINIDYEEEIEYCNTKYIFFLNIYKNCCNSILKITKNFTIYFIKKGCMKNLHATLYFKEYKS